MKKLKDFWAQKAPQYDAEYQFLFDKLASKGNIDGTTSTVSDKGKIFATQYEFYIYAFFLGVYSNIPIDINFLKTGSSFGHNIEYWGKKNKLDRKSFDSIQEYIFVILIVKSDIDFIELERSNNTDLINNAVNKLLKIMRAYTNNGLQIIKELLEDKPNYFYHSPQAAMNLILKYAVNEEKTEIELKLYD